MNISHAEALDWMAYFSKRGTGNDGLRMEIMIAKLMELLARLHHSKRQDGKEYSYHDWAIHVDRPEQESQEVTLESAMRALGINRST